MTSVTRIVCVNDLNGNPRRGWLVSIKDGRMSGDVFIRERFEDDRPLKAFLAGHEGPVIYTQTTVEVSPSVFARLAKVDMVGRKGVES